MDEGLLSKIYLLFIGSYPGTNGTQNSAQKICKSTGIKKSYLSKIKNYFLSKGYITCDNPKDKVKFYSATLITPPFIDEKSFTGVTPYKFPNFTGVSQGGVFSTSKSQWSAPINAKRDWSDLEGWKYYKMKHETVKYYKDIWFGDPINAKLHFQLTIGKNKSSMTVTFPRMDFENKKEFLDAKKQIWHYASLAMHQVAQHLHIGMKIGDIYLANTKCFDYEAKLRDADSKRMADTVEVTMKYHHGDLYVGRLNFDGSGRCERIEGDVPKWVCDYAEIPAYMNRIHDLENDVGKIKTKIGEHDTDIVRLNEKFELVNQTIDKIMEMMGFFTKNKTKMINTDDGMYH